MSADLIYLGHIQNCRINPPIPKSPHEHCAPIKDILALVKEAEL